MQRVCHSGQRRWAWPDNLQALPQAISNSQSSRNCLCLTKSSLLVALDSLTWIYKDTLLQLTRTRMMVRLSWWLSADFPQTTKAQIAAMTKACRSECHTSKASGQDRKALAEIEFLRRTSIWWIKSLKELSLGEHMLELAALLATGPIRREEIQNQDSRSIQRGKTSPMAALLKLNRQARSTAARKPQRTISNTTYHSKASFNQSTASMLKTRW